MYIIYLSGEINGQLIENFIKNFNTVPLDTPITIYINSPGGEVSHASAIIDVINNNSDRITLIAVGDIASAAFNIFFLCNCANKIIVEDTIGMAHFSWAVFELDESGRPKSEYNKFLMEDMKSNKSKTLKKLTKIGLNAKELQRVKKGEEVYFTTKRLNELLKWQKK